MTAEEIAQEIADGMHKPMNIRGKEYNGDVFYDNINFRVDQHYKRKTSKQSSISTRVFLDVCNLLREKHKFYVHS